MGHDVEDSGLHLVLGNGKGKPGIQNGKPGDEAVVKHVTDFEFVLGIGDDTARIHLRTCSCHGQDHTYGDDLLILCRVLLVKEEFLPGIPIIVD
jgi:hypothetical protein